MKENRETSFPSDKNSMRSFLGACNVYRTSVPKLSGIALTLNGMLRKYVEVGWDNPTVEKIEAFEMLKTHSPNAPILRLSKKRYFYTVEPDASQCALGAVLLQEQDVKGDASNGEIKKE